MNWIVEHLDLITGTVLVLVFAFLTIGFAWAVFLGT